MARPKSRAWYPESWITSRSPVGAIAMYVGVSGDLIGTQFQVFVLTTMKSSSDLGLEVAWEQRNHRPDGWKRTSRAPCGPLHSWSLVPVVADQYSTVSS